MNCELMLTYDTPAYMFNVYKNQLKVDIWRVQKHFPQYGIPIWLWFVYLLSNFWFDNNLLIVVIM